MTDKEIVYKIAFQAGIAAAFAATVAKAIAVSNPPMAQRFGNVATLHVEHVLRLLATHHLAVKRHLETMPRAA